MGGFNSGRRYSEHQRRTDVEVCPAIDLRVLKEHLGEDVLITQKIYRNNSLNLKFLIDPSEAEAGFLTVHFPHQGNHQTQQINLTLMNCHLGGSRPFLLCPECREQFLVLYLKDGAWACKNCHGLAYLSQRLNARKRHLHAIQRIEKKKLKGTPPDEKPYRMKQKKHQEIVNELAEHHYELNKLAKKWSDNLEEKYF